MVAREREELACLLDDRALRGRTGHRDAATTAELEQALITQLPQRSEYGVRVTPSTAARSLAGGSRSPGLASPSAMARRISPATCSWRSVGSDSLTLTKLMVLFNIALFPEGDSA